MRSGEHIRKNVCGGIVLIQLWHSMHIPKGFKDTSKAVMDIQNVIPLHVWRNDNEHTARNINMIDSVLIIIFNNCKNVGNNWFLLFIDPRK